MRNTWTNGRNPWRIRKSKIVHANGWFSVEENDVTRPDGCDAEYQIVRFKKHGVGIVAIEDDGRVHMTGQWRLPLASYSWELPMGGVETGESVVEAAQRELSEESGISAGTWTPLLELDLSTSLSDERCTAFLATGLTPKAAHPEPGEALKRKCAPFMEVMERVDRGLIRESVTVAALMRVHLLALAGQLPAALCASMLG